MVAQAPRERRQHGHGARVADGVGGGLLLLHRAEHGVGPAFATSSVAGYEGRRAALLPGLIQSEGRVALGAAMAHGDETVIGPELRPVEREVEGVDGADVRPAAVGPHQVLPHEGRVVRGADAGQEDPLARGYPGRKLFHRALVAFDGPDKCLGLCQDRLVHVVGVRVARIGSHAGPFWMSGGGSSQPCVIGMYFGCEETRSSQASMAG
jgi:hypothetical protein